jgi:CRISPR-associated protein Cmr4
MRIEDAALLFIYAETPLHPGAGSGIGPIDNPVQREVTTGLPVIPASMVKGTLRAEFDSWVKNMPDGEEKTSRQRGVYAVFGPSVTDSASRADRSLPVTYASAAAFTDARLLAFPVRVPQGMFIWVTCPLVLERLRRDLALIPGETRPAIPDLPSLSAGCGALVTDHALLENRQLALEDMLLEDAIEEDRTKDLAGWIGQQVFNDSGDVAYWRGLLSGRMAVIPDQVFCDLTRRCTEIVTRTCMEAGQKVVKSGGLWTEEYIPSETVFYSLILFTTPSERAESDLASARKAREFLEKPGITHLQVGGDETVGRGFARVAFAGKMQAQAEAAETEPEGRAIS